MSRHCPLCTPAIRPQADALIASGVSSDAIGNQLGVSKWTVNRHRHHATPAPVTPASERTPESELRELAELCRQLYNGFIAVNDPKAAADVLKTRARLVDQLANHQAAKAEAATDTNSKHSTTPEQWDAAIAKGRELRQQKLNLGMIPCPACGSWEMIYPSQITARLPAILAAADGAPKTTPETTPENTGTHDANALQ